MSRSGEEEETYLCFESSSDGVLVGAGETIETGSGGDIRDETGLGGDEVYRSDKSVEGAKRRGGRKG